MVSAKEVYEREMGGPEYKPRTKDDPFYCLVTGSVGYEDYDTMSAKLERLLQNYEGNVALCCCGPANIREMVKLFAENYDYVVYNWYPNWFLDGNRAGLDAYDTANRFISGHANRGVVLFWDGVSKECPLCEQKARKYRNPQRIVDIRGTLYEGKG